MDNQMKILITGAKGQLGQSFAKYWYSDKFELCFTDVKELDITNRDETYNFIKEYRPDYILNFAAYTAVDKAETEKKTAFSVNVTAVKNLIEASKINNCKIISISTDFVFSGDKNTPYSETDSTSPLSEYGKTKDLGEKELLLNYNENSMIIRTSWLYSEFGNNFLKTIIKLANQRDELGIIYDQLGAPTYAADLCNILENIVANNKFKAGIFHFSNEGVGSWYDFAYEIVTPIV